MRGHHPGPNGCCGAHLLSATPQPRPRAHRSATMQTTTSSPLSCAERFSRQANWQRKLLNLPGNRERRRISFTLNHFTASSPGFSRRPRILGANHQRSRWPGRARPRLERETKRASRQPPSLARIDQALILERMNRQRIHVDEAMKLERRDYRAGLLFGGRCRRIRCV